MASVGVNSRGAGYLVAARMLCARAIGATLLCNTGLDSQRPALENVITNDLLVAGRWRVRRILRWKEFHHINVLELSSLVVLLRVLAPHCRS